MYIYIYYMCIYVYIYIYIYMERAQAEGKVTVLDGAGGHALCVYVNPPSRPERRRNSKGRKRRRY